MVWAAVVAAGLAALLEESASAYRVLKIIGGLYLLYLGVRALLANRKKDAEPVAPVAASIRSAAVAGLLSTVFNPKVGLFYLAVVPQFLTEVTFGSTMTLGAVECVVAGVVLVTLALAAARAVELLRRPKVTQWLDRISSGILAALGIGTVASGAA